ncbi:hypothetical protein [Vampirovibrio sp.]|uniref:hypothetical protein n=1 Tax=Vampirovibrio sp. TaxID=2717857 RepID=UPI0035937EE7
MQVSNGNQAIHKTGQAAKKPAIKNAEHQKPPIQLNPTTGPQKPSISGLNLSA